MPPILVSLYEHNNEQRSLLEMLIDSTPGLEITGVYCHCHDIQMNIRVHRPDVAVLDIDGLEPDGVEAIRILKLYDPAIRVLAHSTYEDDVHLFNCLRNGADGYLLKKDISQHLIRSIRELHQGGSPLSPGIARKVIQTFHPVRPAATDASRVTPRQREVLSLLAKGYTYRMIALAFSISTETVRRHLKKIYQKLAVRSGPEAVAKAIREKIIRE